jgi:hypothetical protein
MQLFQGSIPGLSDVSKRNDIQNVQGCLTDLKHPFNQLDAVLMPVGWRGLATHNRPRGCVMPENMPQRARKAPRTPREIAKQMATRLENRLMRFVMADAYAEPVPVEEGQKPPKTHLMTGEQVSAALGLLKKYKPDLKSIELKGNDDHPIVTKITREIIRANPQPSDTDSGSVRTPAEPE